MLSVLKEFPNIIHYFLIWGLLVVWLKKNNHKLTTVVIAGGLILFLICSTSFVPRKLIASLERHYSPLQLQDIDRSKTHYIHVLGAGATMDPRLPSSMKLNQESLTRLVEGIRVFNYLDDGVLITSAANEKELKSQAEISKDAALSLGIDGTRIHTLDTPTTTLEEALAFKAAFGIDKRIIIVTSAVHMPRAIEIFKDQGLNTIAAPSGYLYKIDETRFSDFTLPSLKSLELMNIYHVSQLKHVYYRMFKKGRKDE